ncbi:MAG: alpha/beta fold hydrolase [Rhizobiales bacterium]|nr:alpha/beta fold hydrolase [Hyphomicrobiales bacterium]
MSPSNNAAQLLETARETTGILCLPDGRELAWCSYGDPSGIALIHFHGTGFSRLEALTGHAAACAQGIRIVSADRPGFGRSTALPGRSIHDGAQDVATLARHLGLTQYALSGFSGGFPHALALATITPKEVFYLAAMNTAGDLYDPSAKALSVVARLLLKIVTLPVFARWVWTAMFRDLSKSYKVETSAFHTDLVAAAMHEGSEGNMTTIRHEIDMLYQQPWQVDWAAACCPIEMFHGDQDGNLPFVKDLAKRHQNVSYSAIPGAHMDGIAPEVWERLMHSVKRAASAVKPPEHIH